jgi:branched-chain amino acid transport system ATP-binding protein
MSTPLLSVGDLHAWYGESHVLHGINFEVYEGEVVTLLGRNGAGRTTTLRAILGLTSRRRGKVKIGGVDVTGLAPHAIARLGVGYCPEERGIFASLSTIENLNLLPQVGNAPMGIDEVFDMFPNLKERAKSPAGRLSGGEQQMLAIARILRTGAKLLLLDEITEGLAPVIVQKLAQVLTALRKRAYTIVLVEQNFRFAAPLADRHYVIEHGKVLQTIASNELVAKGAELNAMLGL